MRDLHTKIKVVHAITPQAVGTSGIAGGKLSGVLDRRGYDSAEFVFSYGTSASAADTITPVIYESTATGSGFTSVADADLLPQASAEAAVTLSAAGSSKIGYIGSKRYLKIRLYGTGHATGIVSAALLLSNPDRQPVT
jgi:hypothetical protein